MAGKVGHDEIVEALHRLHAAQGAHHQFPRPLIQPAAGHFQVLPPQRLAHVVDRQVVGPQFPDVHRDLHRARAGAEHADRADVLHRLQVLLDEFVGDVGDLLEVARGADTNRDHRDGVEVKLVDDGRIGSGRQARENGVDLVPHVLRGDVPIAFQEKLHRDLRHPLGGHAAQFVDALDGVDDFFQRLGDAGLHLLRRGPSQGGGDGDDGQLDVGELVDANVLQAKPAQHDEEQIDHRGEHRPFDAEVGQAHAPGWGQRGRWCGRRFSGFHDVRSPPADRWPRLAAGLSARAARPVGSPRSRHREPGCVQQSSRHRRLWL